MTQSEITGSLKPQYGEKCWTLPTSCLPVSNLEKCVCVCVGGGRERDRERDRETDRQTDRQRERVH